MNIQCQAILRRAVMITTTHACVSTSQVTQITFSILFPQVRPKNLTLERQQLKKKLEMFPQIMTT